MRTNEARTRSVLAAAHNRLRTCSQHQEEATLVSPYCNSSSPIEQGHRVCPASTGCKWPRFVNSAAPSPPLPLPVPGLPLANHSFTVSPPNGGAWAHVQILTISTGESTSSCTPRHQGGGAHLLWWRSPQRRSPWAGSSACASPGGMTSLSQIPRTCGGPR